MTDKPFGVNLTFLPSVEAPDYPAYVQTIINGGVKVVETAGRNPAQVASLSQGRGHHRHPQMHLRPPFIEGAGKSAVMRLSVDGFECGGHPGEDDIPNMILLPRAADELEIPFVASGGMADGRSLVAALAMGAEGNEHGHPLHGDPGGPDP